MPTPSLSRHSSSLIGNCSPLVDDADNNGAMWTGRSRLGTLRRHGFLEGIYRATIQGGKESKAAGMNNERSRHAFLDNGRARHHPCWQEFLPVFSIRALEAPPNNDRLVFCAIQLIASWALSRILHKGALKKGRRNRRLNDLAWKWGTQSDLDASHRYKSSPS